MTTQSSSSSSSSSSSNPARWVRRNVVGMVLNGGQSRRMGRDKAALRISGRALIERTLDILWSLFDEVLVVGRPVAPDGTDGTYGTDRTTEPLEAAPSHPSRLTPHASRGTRHVPDAIPGAGPLGGIYSGLLAMSRPFGFVVACDMPCLDASVIARQLEVLRESGADAVVPHWESYLEPLHAAYSRTCLPAIQRQIDRGDFRIRSFFGSVRVACWDVLAEGIALDAFANVNTRSELAALRASGALSGR